MQRAVYGLRAALQPTLRIDRARGWLYGHCSQGDWSAGPFTDFHGPGSAAREVVRQFDEHAQAAHR